MSPPRRIKSATDSEQLHSFLDATAMETLCEWLVRLAAKKDGSSLELLRASLLYRVSDTYAKHVVPRLISRALIQRGAAGVAVLADLARSPETPGAIYPAAILETLSDASRGAESPLGGMSTRYCRGLSMTLPTETMEMATRALEDLYAEASNDPELFDRVVSDMYHSTLMAAHDDQWRTHALQLLSRGLIRISPSLLRQFEELMSSGGREEEYQIFLSEHPILLDPLAAEVIPKQRLGVEHATDYAVRRHDLRYLLVEIERPDTPIFTRAGDLSAGFTHAFGQVLDFLRWVERHAEYARHLMPEISSPRGLLVIGRRSSLDEDRKGKLARFVTNSAQIDVRTFDDLLHDGWQLYRSIWREQPKGVTSSPSDHSQRPQGRT
jgi:hypothetical protein